jgi:hypothetical protein
MLLKSLTELTDPHRFGGDALEARSESLDMRDLYYSEFEHVKRATEPSAPVKGSSGSTGAASAGGTTEPKGHTKGAVSGSKVPSAKGGALATKVVTLSPRPTTCKKNEKATALDVKDRLIKHSNGRVTHSSKTGAKSGTHAGVSASKHGAHKKGDAKGSSPLSASASASSTPALVARATPAAPSKGAASTTSASSGAAPTSPPTGAVKGHSGKGAKGAGKIATLTRAGRDGHSTVYHVHHATKTPCYSKNGAGAKVAHDAKATPSPSLGSGKAPKTPTASKTGAAAAADPKAPSKTTPDAKLMTRYEELLE